MSTFRFQMGLPVLIQWKGREFERDDFYAWIWETFQDRGLLGVHEGTILSEEAHQAGFETESFTVDAGEAPRERDWVGNLTEIKAELYFSDSDLAASALKELRQIPGISLNQSIVEEVPSQDWDAEWKKSFQGIHLPPYWKVLPPWVEESGDKGPVVLRLNPGAGFGTGTHETTQLCLEFLGEEASRIQGGFQGLRCFDFGSGSGILSIGAALLGAKVDACEIDPLANDNAFENAKLNGVEAQIKITENLKDCVGKYPIVLANILKPVLLQFADELVSRLSLSGVLILSGLVQADVETIAEAFSSRLAGVEPEIRSRGDWRALRFNRQP